MKELNIKIKLTNCAYIFDYSNNNVKYGTREQIEREYKINNYLKSFYNNDHALNNWLECKVIYNEYMNNRYLNEYYINIPNVGLHVLNDIRCIQETTEELDNFTSLVINNKCNLKIENYKNKSLYSVKYGDNVTVYSKKFNSFMFENFTQNKKDLQYMRIKYNRNKLNFIVLKDGTFSTCEGMKPKEINEVDILNMLQIKTPQARKEIFELLCYIRTLARTQNN